MKSFLLNIISPSKFVLSASVICTQPNCTTEENNSCPSGSEELPCITNCSSSCEGPRCVSTDGSVECRDGCKDGYSGRACHIPCIHNCLRCKRDKRDACILCVDGFYGSNCEHSCSADCGLRGCYRNGVCEKDCPPQNVCGNTCLYHCKACNASSGKCRECTTGRHGELCQKLCHNCRYNICHKVTGKCFECREGYYGSDCQSSCSHCKSGVCWRSDGKCIQHQLSTTIVDLSTTSVPQTQVMQPQTIAFICFGVLFGIVVSSLLCKLCRRSSWAPLQQTEDIENRSLPDVPTDYVSNGYYEINEEDLDPRCSHLVRPHNSVDTDVDAEIRNRAAGTRPVLAKILSKDDSLIIPTWLWQEEENSSSSNIHPVQIRYLSPLENTNSEVCFDKHKGT